MFDIFSAVDVPDAEFIPMVSTGTMLDYLTGAFVPGINGSSILEGGLASSTGFHGPPASFKSTVSDGTVINAMERWPGTQYITYDTENSKRNKQRLLGMATLYLDDPVKRAAHLEDLDKRIRIINLTGQPYLEGFMELVTQIYDTKMKNLKQFEVEIPILDARTGKPRRMILPTFISIDSLSKAKLKAVLDVLDKKGETSSDANILAAREALYKTRYLQRIPSMAERAGIYFVLTGQNAQSMEVGGSPPAKNMQFMKAGEKVKGVGSDWMYLVQTDIGMRLGQTLFDDNKQCEYPYPTGIVAPTEMSEIPLTVIRSKNHSSGIQFSPVVSQSFGYEPNLTNYNYLRKKAGFFGLGKDRARPRPALYPDQFFMRTTAYAKMQDPLIARAVELTTALHVIQSNWTTLSSDVPYDISPEQLAEKLDKSGYARDDILASRGWWTYAKREDDYLSLRDVLRIVTGDYKPKLHSAGAAPKAPKAA